MFDIFKRLRAPVLLLHQLFSYDVSLLFDSGLLHVLINMHRSSYLCCILCSLRLHLFPPLNGRWSKPSSLWPFALGHFIHLKCQPSQLVYLGKSNTENASSVFPFLMMYVMSISMSLTKASHIDLPHTLIKEINVYTCALEQREEVETAWSLNTIGWFNSKRTLVLPTVRDNPTTASRAASTDVDQKVSGVAFPFKPRSRSDKETVIAHPRKMMVLFLSIDLVTLKQLPEKQYW